MADLTPTPPANRELADFANDLLAAWNIEDTNEPSLTEQFLDMFHSRFDPVSGVFPTPSGDAPEATPKGDREALARVIYPLAWESTAISWQAERKDSLRIAERLIAAGLAVTPNPEAHWECNCVPDLGPTHCHACGFIAGHPVPWSESVHGPVTPNGEQAARADGVALIAAERERQQTQEGYTAAHDFGHEWELVRAGVLYADNTAQILAGLPHLIPGAEWNEPQDPDAPNWWPWAARYWKPTGDPVRDLTKAGALIAAAIDSLAAASCRAATTEQEGTSA